GAERRRRGRLADPALLVRDRHRERSRSRRRHRGSRRCRPSTAHPAPLRRSASRTAWPSVEYSTGAAGTHAEAGTPGELLTTLIRADTAWGPHATRIGAWGRAG